MIAERSPISLPYSGTSDLERYRRVKIVDGEPAYAGLDDDDIGVLQHRVVGTPSSGPVPLGSGQAAAVVLKTESGIHKMVSAGAITKGAEVFTAAAGKVSATVARFVGIAMSATTGDGQIIDVLRSYRSINED